MSTLNLSLILPLIGILLFCGVVFFIYKRRKFSKLENLVIEKNTIQLGDSLILMEKIPDKSIDMIFADLPYGTTNCKWDSVIPLDQLWAAYKRIIKEDGAIVLFAQTPFDKQLGSSNFEWLRYEWIWEKTQATGHLNAKKMPMKAHENLLVFYKKKPVYNPQMTHGHERKVSTIKHKKNTKSSQCEIYNKAESYIDYDSTDRFPRSVLKFASDKQKQALHPTQKPVALCEYMIKTYTNKGDLVLDNCIGSGTTAIACLNTERQYIGMELDEHYYNVSLIRIQEWHKNNKYGYYVL